MFVYQHAGVVGADDLYNVGFYRADGRFEVVHSRQLRDEAESKVHYLNGGTTQRIESLLEKLASDTDDLLAEIRLFREQPGL